MAKEYVEDVRMDSASNGVIIEYRKCTVKDPKKGNTYENTESQWVKEVFDVDDEDEGEDSEFEKAFSRYKELFKQAMNYKKSKS